MLCIIPNIETRNKLAVGIQRLLSNGCELLGLRFLLKFVLVLIKMVLVKVQFIE